MKNLKIGRQTTEAIAVGFMSGSRASSAPAITSILLAKGKKPGSKLLAAIAGKKIMRVLIAMALPELMLDKMPFVGNRIQVGGVAGRAATGGLGGSAIYSAAGKPALRGAMMGATAAVISTYSLFYLRRELGKKTGIKDPWIGLAEDVLMVGLGVWLVSEKVKSEK